MMNGIKKYIRSIYTMLVSRAYASDYKKLLKINNIPNKPCLEEDKWINKWSILNNPNPIYYRLFSHYIGNDLNIISEDICRNIVEPILNPMLYVPYYSDKNIFDKLFIQSALPKTIFRKMQGFYYDDKYNSIELIDDIILYNLLNSSNYKKIIIKPSVDSSSGKGIRLFENKNNEWIEIGSNNKLTLKFLESNYGDNIIVQECVEQSECMSYYNPTSVNTLRLTLYRSVKTNECHIPSAIIRIGAIGALVDNAHAGGGYVGINVADGSLCKRVLNQYGEFKTEFNNIDFSKDHKIQNWNEVLEFAKYIGQNVPHHRLLALDIMIDKLGMPRLVEFNCEAYSMWLFQFSVGSAFGDFTDEIIEYCKNNIHQAYRTLTI